MKPLSLALSALVLAAAAAAQTSPVQMANPLQGTDSSFAFSHGNEYPAIALPFPMNTWAPYTQPLRDSFFYQYRQTKLRGIRQTHQPSPWIADYAAFALMPVSGKLAVKEDERASEFRHGQETAQPSYYRVRLGTWKATAEVTPTERCASFRFTFEEPGGSYVVLDAFTGGSAVEVIPSEHKIIGTPLFDRATLRLPGGKTFTITAPGNGPQHPYIGKAALNGAAFNRTYLGHQEIVNGGELVFEMASAPGTKWASGAESRPPKLH